jgi:Cd2+/Zn2+-exporting ATPase
MEQTKLTVQNMCCPEEVRTVEKTLRQLPGVAEVRANLLDRAVQVLHDPELTSGDDLVRALSSTGMKASAEEIPGQAAPVRNWHSILTGISGVGLAAGLVSHWVQRTEAFEKLPFAVAIVAGGWFIAPKAWFALKRLSPDMNLLMSLATLGALGIGAWHEAATVIFLFSLAELLESFSLTRARRAIRQLMTLAPKTAWVKRGPEFQELPVSEVVVGDRLLIKPGGRIPLDGVVQKGESSVDQSPITGESLPVDKAEGDSVFAGSINREGSLEIRVTKPYADTTLAKIIHLVEEAQSQKAPAQRFVDRFASLYTPVVLALALGIAAIPPLAFGQPWAGWFYRALVMLVIACPCALVISTPVAVVSGLTSAARKGVLIKGGAFLERLGRLRTLCLDKTGTLTEGRPKVTEILALGSAQKESILAIASALEAHSEHPVARAILEHAKETGLSYPAATSFRSLTGKGVIGGVDGQEYFLGNHKMVEELAACGPEIERTLEAIESRGITAVVLGRRAPKDGPGEVIGVIGVGDAIRQQAKAALLKLRNQGVRRLVLLTGDNRATANRIAQEVGVDEVYAELLPQEKVHRVQQLMRESPPVGMIGDGINDAPALAAADVGIAMGVAGTDVALETADVALMADDLTKLPAAMAIGRLAERVIQQNILFAIGEKALFLVLAAAGIATLWMAIAADMGASLLVISNGLRLLKENI